MLWYEDVDSDCLVRCEGWTVERISPQVPQWVECDLSSSYAREIFLGQGNTCLFDITEAEALRRISEWVK